MLSRSLSIMEIQSVALSIAELDSYDALTRSFESYTQYNGAAKRADARLGYSKGFFIQSHTVNTRTYIA